MAAEVGINSEQRMKEEMAHLSMIPAFVEAAKQDPDGARMAAVLTPRERMLVGCLADGMGNQEIGTHLGIAQDTVKKHTFRIFEKLGFNTRAQLIVAVYRRAALRAAVPIPSLMMEAK